MLPKTNWSSTETWVGEEKYPYSQSHTTGLLPLRIKKDQCVIASRTVAHHILGDTHSLCNQGPLNVRRYITKLSAKYYQAQCIASPLRRVETRGESSVIMEHGRADMCLKNNKDAVGEVDG